MRLSDPEFLRLTIRQFVLLLERHRDALDQQLYGPAMVCSVIANIHRDKRKRSQPFEPKDFLPKRDNAAGMEIPDGEMLYQQTLAIFGTTETP